MKIIISPTSQPKWVREAKLYYQGIPLVHLTVNGLHMVVAITGCKLYVRIAPCGNYMTVIWHSRDSTDETHRTPPHPSITHAALRALGISPSTLDSRWGLEEEAS